MSFECDIIPGREIIDIEAFNQTRFKGSCVYHLFNYSCVYLSIHFHKLTVLLNQKMLF